MKPLKRFLKFCGSIFKKPSSSKSYPNVSDSARSVSVGTVVELLASGGKYGLQMFPGGDLQSNTYISDTPILRDGQYFFKGITTDFRTGSPGQTALGGFYFGGMLTETAVGSEVRYGLPIIRAFINSNATIIRCRFSVILLKNRRENGQVVQVIGNSITFRVSIKEKNTGFLVKPDITLEGKYTEPYEQVFEWQVNNTGEGDEFIIKVERITGIDGTDDTRVLSWSSYTECISQNLPFKRIAHVGIRFDADEFGTSFPDRQYRIGGQFLDIPTNGYYSGYDGIPNYFGNWDGQLKPMFDTACEDFGAIIWYLLLDEIDGLGLEIKEYMVDRYSLFAISRYNSQYVPASNGQYERRYTCNMVINKQEDGWKVIDSILSGCFARRYWEGGILKFTQDKPGNIFALITDADIYGDFEYSNTDIDERATAVNVTWTDLSDFSKTRTEYVTDATLVARQGYNLKNIEAVGCIRRSQANRYGRAIIYSENYECALVTFTGRQYLAYIPIGSIVAISDANVEKQRIGGIVQAVNNNIITVDYPVSIKTPQGFDEYMYLLFYPDVKLAIENGGFNSPIDHYLQYGQAEGRYPNGYALMVQTKTGVQVARVTNSIGSYTALYLDRVIQNVEVNANWILFAPDNKHKLFRVLSKEPDDQNLDRVVMTCTEYSDFKWEKIERSLDIGLYKNLKAYPNTTYVVNDATNFQFVQKTVSSNKVNINVSWTPPANTVVSKYILGYAITSSLDNYSLINWTDTTVLNDNNITNYTFTNLSPNTYAFRIIVINYQDQASRGAFIQPTFYSL